MAPSFEKDVKTNVTSVSPDGEVMAYDNAIDPPMGGSQNDQRDMYRVGKKQELNRNFHFISIVGFTAVFMCTWEAVLITANYGLINGGLGGMIWTYLGTVTGFTAAILAMAEMSSMAPTSGGQYHWVSEFAPPSIQKFTSYMTGWLCVMGWQTLIASGGYISAILVQALLVLNDPSYVWENWHGTLLIMLVAIIAILFNTFLARKLPLIEGVILILHICGFFAILIPLWVLAPRHPASMVFGQIQDNGGWGNKGLACLVGMLGPIYSLAGPDSAVHMAEEIKDASRVLPLGMLWTLALNGITGFIMLITFCFTVGNVNDVLASDTGFPFVAVFYNATGSMSGTIVMTSIIIILNLCSTISNVATASRQMFAFARDGGLPFSSFISHVYPKWSIPLNAVLVSFVIVILLSLINIGSDVAFNAIVSLGIASLLTSYIISTSCVRWKQWRGEPLPPKRWSMGKWSPYVNTFAILYLMLAFIFSFFPLSTPVTPQTMNWSVVIYVGVMLIAVIYYYVHARHIYIGPVALVKSLD